MDAIPDRVIDALWPPQSTDGTSVWAILDCARDDRVYEALKTSRLDYRCLYSGRLPRALEAEISERLVRELRAVGYQHVTIDLQGYRMGSLNEGVPLRVV